MASVALASCPGGRIYLPVPVSSGGQLDSVLAPAVGCSVFIYEHGTTSPEIQLYQDAELTIPLAQPTTTDSQGGIVGFVERGQYLDAVAAGGGLVDTLVQPILDVDPTPVATVIPTLDRIPAPVANVSMGGNRLVNLADPVASTDALNVETGDARYKNSPSLTGSPTAPTQAPLDDSTKIATTAYADSAVAVEEARAESVYVREDNSEWVGLFKPTSMLFRSITGAPFGAALAADMPSNTGDDTEMLQEIFAAPDTVLMPYSGAPWQIFEPLVNSTAGKRIHGMGPLHSVIEAAFTTDQLALVQFNPATGGSSKSLMGIHGLGLIGNAHAQNGVLVGDKAYQWVVEHCQITNVAGANNNGQGGCAIGMANPATGTGSGDTSTGQHYSGLVARCILFGNDTGVQARERSQWLVIWDTSVYNNNHWGIDAWRDQTTVAGGKLYVVECDVESNGNGAVPSIGSHSYPTGNIRLLGPRVAIIRDIYMELSSPWMGVNILVDQDAANNVPQVVLIEGGYILGDSNIPYGIVLRAASDVTIRNNWFGSYTTTDGEVIVDPNTGQVKGYQRYENNTDGNSNSRSAVADANYTQLDRDCYVAYTSITAPRTVSLITPVGRASRTLVIKDESGSCSPSTPITAAGAIEGGGAASITAPYGVLRLRSNGTVWGQL